MMPIHAISLIEVEKQPILSITFLWLNALLSVVTGSRDQIGFPSAFAETFVQHGAI